MTATAAGKQQLIPIEFLVPGRYQPRKHFAQQELQELAATMKRLHVLQPLVVRRMGDQRFEIIAGERRWRAAQLAELGEVPCIVRELNDEDVALIALIENIQRQELNAIEEADAYQRLIDEFRLTHDEVASRVGKKRETVTNSLRLLLLPLRIREWIAGGLLSASAGKTIAGIGDTGLQIELATHCRKDRPAPWSMRRLETEIEKRKVAQPGTASRPRKDPNVVLLEETVSEVVGFPCEIQWDANSGGKLTFTFTRPCDLDNLLANLKPVDAGAVTK
jgi:ParB family transcriptional regulator, chromosome partitioning protein